MEGTHKKKIFSSNYIETESLNDLVLSETIVLNQYIIFQFKGYASLYELNLDSANLIIKFSKPLNGFFKDIQLLADE
jgi:hypothetical protein